MDRSHFLGLGLCGAASGPLAPMGDGLFREIITSSFPFGDRNVAFELTCDEGDFSMEVVEGECSGVAGSLLTAKSTLVEYSEVKIASGFGNSSLTSWVDKEANGWDTLEMEEGGSLLVLLNQPMTELGAMV